LNVLGSLFVVFNSARLVREGEEFDAFDIAETDSSQKTEDSVGKSGEMTPAAA